MGSTLAAKALALMALPGVGQVTLSQRLHKRRTLSATYDSFVAETGASLGSLLPACQDLIARAEDQGLGVLHYDDPGYPRLLHEAQVGPPVVIFVQGTLPLQVRHPDVTRTASVAVVGTRRATKEGLREAAAVANALAEAGVSVVSGLAIGVDAAAHEGSLAAAGRAARKVSVGGAGRVAPTVAVLGGAHDRLHPKANEGLAEAILARRGAIVSEYPPGVRPNRGSFLARNRIIAGLSRAVVVVEAGERSGALSTARDGLNAGIPVLTVPARPTDVRRAGNLALLRDGAAPLIDLTDLAGALSALPEASAALMALSSGASATGPEPHDRSGSAVHLTDTGGPAVQAAEPAGAVASGALEGRALAALRELGDMSFDGLLSTLYSGSRDQAPSPAPLAGALVRLEMTGAVVRRDDGRFAAAGPLLGGRPSELR